MNIFIVILEVMSLLVGFQPGWAGMGIPVFSKLMTSTHDFSMTICQFSMTLSLCDFAFAAFMWKRQKMQTFYIIA